jgi:hypothetical protein
MDNSDATFPGTECDDSAACAITANEASGEAPGGTADGTHDMVALRFATSRADRLGAAIITAAALARATYAIDLAGLDDEVGRLCAGALDLPVYQGRIIRRRLQALMTEIDALREAIT